jgi:hypothetical protein
LYYSKDSRFDNEILNGKQKLTQVDWGVTTLTKLPVDNHSYFENDLSLVDWLRQWVKQKKNVMRLIFASLVK